MSETQAPPNPTLIFENDDYLVLNKPSGLASATLPSGSGNASVEDWLRGRAIGNSLPEHGLVHRLDTGTSGLLLVAKTQGAYDYYRASFRGELPSSGLSKHYRCRCKRSTKSTSAQLDLTQVALPYLIDWPIGHDEKSKKKMRVITAPEHERWIRGKPLPAVTWITARKRINDGSFVFSVRIETGVQHQIRAHLAAAGFPILGDSTYQGSEFGRLALHAQELVFKDSSGNEQRFNSDPEDQIF